MDARYEIYRREETYRFYIADTLYYQAQNKALTLRYAEVLKQMETPVDTTPVNGDEIAIEIMTKYGLRFEE